MEAVSSMKMRALLGDPWLVMLCLFLFLEVDSAWSWKWRVEASREGNTSAKACEQVVRGLVAERHLARTAGGIRSMSKRKRIHEGRHWRADDCVESLSSNQRKTKSRRAVCEGDDVVEIEVEIEIE